MTLTLFWVPQSLANLSNQVSKAGTKWLHCKIFSSPLKAFVAAGATAAAGLAAGLAPGEAPAAGLAAVAGEDAGLGASAAGFGASAGLDGAPPPPQAAIRDATDVLARSPPAALVRAQKSGISRSRNG